MTGIFEEKALLTAEKVAEVLGLKPSTIMKWVYERKIPFVKFGPGKKAIVKFNPKRLNQWLDEQSHEPESEDENKSSAKKIKKASRRTVERFNEFASTL
ncbi:MAG: helix-turn-helix domain-containing protein [Candidatus Aminicenantes bacterium]|nr:helix-turn-helix domain-containing protein [Candidatus Aminicenantes bacterium]NIQ66911.1 helix-turn-helix domain-containing protein [Candidatus Aminicenantes bacterium]NIT22954.1 helix-turn-helix domain-containing protein [Candidatus Aminicenantes bacterium]